MKLSEFKNEKALDVLAEIIEPITEIVTDSEVKAYIKEKNKIKAISKAIKNHKKEIIYILAVLDDKPLEGYEINLATLPLKIMEVLSDEVLNDFFTSVTSRIS